MCARPMRALDRSSGVGLEAQPCVILGQVAIVSRTLAPSHRPSRQLKSLLTTYRPVAFFGLFFSQTGAEKLLGLSEPAPQIPGRALRHFWLWFDPSALGVNVDRTRDTRAFLTVKLPHF